jgi:asparagine synthase (glutamine-hydrolysing)
MCGLVGIASPRHLRAVPRRELEPMLRTIAYRGPDDEAFAELAGFSAGFRRLAILDVAHGRQPMTTPDGRFTIVHNGEIYDHLDLRRALEADGARFATTSDAETLLQAFARFGPDVVRRVRGIFAFAIWDAVERRLFLARDPSGVKPLYVARIDGELWFASEAKALLARQGAERGLDPVRLFAPPPEDASIFPSAFRGVLELAPGARATFDASGELSAERYFHYAPRAEPDDEVDRDAHVAAFAEEVARVVRMQLLSDVPLGACLSGGLDSSLITALAAADAPRLATFTTVVEGSQDPWNAFLLARAKGLDAHYLAFEPEVAVADLRRIAWASEGLFDLAFVSRHELCRAARDRGVRVLLSGQGLDELVGGYDESPEAMLRAARRDEAARDLVASTHPDLERLFADPVDATRPDDARRVAARLRRHFADLSRYLLRFEDRMGMLAGVEIRVPFLDPRVVERCAAVGPKLRAELFGDKRIVREAARGVLPEPIRLRRKLALNGNMPSMFAALERAKSDLSELLSERTVREKGYFDPERVRHLVDTRDERLLDAVLAVHLLDDVFVAGLDASRAEAAQRALPPEIRVDEAWMPAEALLFAARTGSRAGDVPRLSREIAFFGRLCAASEPARDLLAIRTIRGEDLHLVPPDDLDLDAATAFLGAIDGARSYAVLAEALGLGLDAAIALGRFFAERGLVAHGRAG